MPNLTSEDIQVILNTIQAQNVLVDVGNLTYLGYGSYNMTFGVESTDVKNITLTVTTPSGITVSASTSGEWKSLYLTSQEGEVILVPISQFDPTQFKPHKKYFVITPSSRGQSVREIQSISLNRSITLQETIAVKLFFEFEGGEGGKNVSVTVELVFQYEGETYWIGNDTKLICRGGGPPNPYIFTINTEDGEYPEGYGTRVIPKNSIFILRITAISDSGFNMKIHYGPQSLSQIVL